MTKQSPRLILSSASARRVRLLGEAGAQFDSIVPEVDESACSASVRDTVMKNARLKGEWALARFPDCAIVSADTAIEFEDSLIGKPKDLLMAREHLRAFSGRTHNVLTGISCLHPGREPYRDAAVSTVKFRELSEEMISHYFSLVDPLDKAGSYDIGSHGETIIEEYTGSLSNIIGLPMELVTPWLVDTGYIS